MPGLFSSACFLIPYTYGMLMVTSLPYLPLSGKVTTESCFCTIS